MACRHYCSELNPDTTFEVHNMNVAAEENRVKFKETLQSGGLDRKSSVSMMVGCVDNMEARQLMEQMSEELQIPYIDAVVSDDAMSGSVQLIIPGRTGGLEAAPIKSHMEKRPGACPASLPTTDSIISGTRWRPSLTHVVAREKTQMPVHLEQTARLARPHSVCQPTLALCMPAHACPLSPHTGITGQNVLKYLLGFGEVAFLIQYNAITNDFQSRMTYPDPRKAGGAPGTPGA